MAAWLAYLVPAWIRRSQRDAAVPSDPAERFSDSVRIVRDGSIVSQPEEGPDVEVSTPFTRRAALGELKRRDQRAAGRRRVLLISIMVALVVVVGVTIAGLVPVWTPAIPVGLLVVFVGAARISVASMDRERREILDSLRRGNEEDTVVLSADDLEKVDGGAAGSTVVEVALGAPKPSGSALWDAVPVTTPTYVQTPTPPRTVRTIDLSAPSAPAPVTADPKSATEVEDVEVEQPRKKASGE
ncbi:hypothetical protein GCM10028815_32170 [Mariniluteicoccus flavus]